MLEKCKLRSPKRRKEPTEHGPPRTKIFTVRSNDRIYSAFSSIHHDGPYTFLRHALRKPVKILLVTGGKHAFHFRLCQNTRPKPKSYFQLHLKYQDHGRKRNALTVPTFPVQTQTLGLLDRGGPAQSSPLMCVGTAFSSPSHSSLPLTHLARGLYSTRPAILA